MSKHKSPLLLPEDIKFFRESLGMTPEQLGNELGYHADSIRQLETPNVNWTMPDMPALKLIGLYLKDNSPMAAQNSSYETIDQIHNSTAH